MNITKAENGFWYDENNNFWLTEAQAREKSPTLTNCKNCSHCKYCKDCNHCSNCRYCKNCDNCNDCSDSFDCEVCIDCFNCKDCNYCKHCLTCKNCGDCSFCSYCKECKNCSYCDECKGFKTNPARYITLPLGSRKAQTRFYWTTELDLYVVCGCFKGTLKEFEYQVNLTHGTNKRAVDYLKVINQVKLLISDTNV